MSDTATEGRTSLLLAETCWPIFEFLTNFIRQIKHGVVPAPDKVRYEALAALRDAEDLSRNDPVTERAWLDRVKAMMVYFLDYKMLNTEWEGRDYWSDNPFETDPMILDHAQSLGGEDFFRDCDDMQREYELAERRDRGDKDELAGVLNLYFVCLRLGFRGQYHDRPQELADYTRRLFTRLPAHATTRGKEMFPETYKHNQEIKVNYNLGKNLTIVLTIFAAIIGLSLLTFRVAWGSAVREIQQSAQKWQSGEGGMEATDGEMSDAVDGVER